MSVFISYKHLDRNLALQIDERLKINGIKTYLDVLDAESQSTESITTVITKNIAMCTHLIAVVSKETATSWWVPFEIGEATISAKRIASYRSSYSSTLPEYLEMWPKMDSMQHLELFIAAYKNEQLESVSNRYSFESARSGVKSASDFHSTLKAKIRRGY